ncbi:hypothetical protein COHA_003527 [Chlorella ohadii]|uniref:Methyltransferase FkbM domain-containing protein n=1 Tax=Chlorella ohadii TaxID=2649997 RepID=A0AAD5H3Q1_9CHLO|nr:hypothetical protein COHA_003527 [Chlorella ohadii]
MSKAEGSGLRARPALAIFAVCCALGLLALYRPAGQANEATLQKLTGLMYRPTWGDMPANMTIPMSVPGWAWDAAAATTGLVDGKVNMSVPWNSQFGEDKWLMQRMYYNKRNGFYLEFGAHDGASISNTKWLHDNAGWKGMLIEANPVLYTTLAANRPQDINIGVAICDKFQIVHFANRGNVGGIWEFMNPEHMEKWFKGFDESTLSPVACVPLMFLLDRFGVKHIDFWSLDVEGAELAVLKAFDFSQVTVDVIVAETSGDDPAKDEAVCAILANNGFVAVEHSNKDTLLNKMDTFFVHRRVLRQRSHGPGFAELKT